MAKYSNEAFTKLKTLQEKIQADFGPCTEPSLFGCTFPVCDCHYDSNLEKTETIISVKEAMRESSSP